MSFDPILSRALIREAREIPLGSSVARPVMNSLAEQLAAAMTTIDRLNQLIEEHRGAIGAFNLATGGSEPSSLENLRRLTESAPQRRH